MASPLGLSFIADSKDTRIPQYFVTENKAVKSLFNLGQFSPFPTTKNEASGSVTGIKSAFDIHNDDVNDISIGSIIEYCSHKDRPAMKLNYAHFAYLRKLGVYPNNRLIIARRFAGGVANDLNEIKEGGGAPLATLISWFGEDEEPISVKFNEEWEEADGGFEDVLNEIGEDILLGDNKGGKLGGANKNAFGIIPLPGLMEGVQLEMYNILGISGENQGAGMSPAGNPNLIREAQVRKVIKKGTAGSGLSCDIGIKMTVEYEQKFINGVDPTLVYLDILQNALTFGTSESVFQFSSAFGSGTNDIIQKLISGDIRGIIQAITQMITALINALKTAINKIVTDLTNAIDEKEKKKDETPEDKANAEKGIITQAGNLLIANLDKVLKVSLGTVVSKYKVRLQGIVNALTGQNSTPWHITIGNPKKPIFCSGDMLCSDVTITLGKVLAFNDLPSSITITCNFKNARGLGSQEIFNKFNSGRGRSYTRINKSFVEVSDFIVDEVVNEVINKENAAKKSETQKTTKEENKPATTPGTTPIDAAGGKKSKDTPPAKDDYPVDFGKEGLEWGPRQLEPPPPPTTSDGYLKRLLGEPDPNASATKTSSQSVSDPNTKAEIKASGNKLLENLNSTTPGVTQSASEIQSQINAGNTEALPPPPLNIEEPVREQEPEIGFIDENGNFVSNPALDPAAGGSEPLKVEPIASTQESTQSPEAGVPQANQNQSAQVVQAQSPAAVTSILSGVSEEQLLQRIDSLESELSKLDKEIAENNVLGVSNDDIFAKYITRMNELYKIQEELNNRG